MALFCSTATLSATSPYIASGSSSARTIRLSKITVRPTGASPFRISVLSVLKVFGFWFSAHDIGV
jgi:hypothetical protein